MPQATEQAQNVCNQRLATLDFPSAPILSRVRCIAWLSPAAFLRLKGRKDGDYAGKPDDV